MTEADPLALGPIGKVYGHGGCDVYLKEPGPTLIDRVTQFADGMIVQGMVFNHPAQNAAVVICEHGIPFLSYN